MKSYNGVDFQGRLYDYNLEEKDFGKGDVIVGDITLEVSEKGDKVKARFFASPTYASGKPNRTYEMLSDIMAGDYASVVDSGDSADWFGINGNLEGSYFPARDGSCESPDDLTKSLKVRGVFLNSNKERNYRNKWQLDMLITNIREVEADVERGRAEYVEVSGFYVDEYHKHLMDVSVRAYDEAAINFYKSQKDNVSVEQPMFARVWGGRKTFRSKFVQKSMFGEDEVTERENEFWVLTNQGTPYDFGEENVMTREEYDEYRNALAEYKQKVFDERVTNNEDNNPNLAF